MDLSLSQLDSCPCEINGGFARVDAPGLLADLDGDDPLAPHVVELHALAATAATHTTKAIFLIFPALLFLGTRR